MSPLLSAATRFSRQIATGSFSTRPRRHAGSHGRSQVRPRIPGKTFDSQLIAQASPNRRAAIRRVYFRTGGGAGQGPRASTTLLEKSGVIVSVGCNNLLLPV